jgi:hypothetical protein
MRPNPRIDPAISFIHMEFLSTNFVRRIRDPCAQTSADRIGSHRAAKSMRSADELAQRADQQRQTHWRRCVRGPSGNSESAAFQARLGSETIATSGIATGTASVGA